MSPTLTVDTDSEPGSWARYSMLTDPTRVEARMRVRSLLVRPNRRQPAPTCATCGGRICSCSDAQWVGASQSVHNGEVY